mgnify:CR=1 FL=1
MRLLKRVLKVFIVALIFIVSMLYFFQEKLIFHSSELPQDYEFQFTTSFEELFLKAEDGAVLNGLHFKQENPKGVILYTHGNAGELNEWGKWGEALSNRYNHDVVIWDYRGYGKSTGKRRQKLMLDDSYLFYDYCKDHFNEDQITLFGRSLGGFFATHVAKDRAPKNLVLESTPFSLLKIAQKEYPFLPSKYLLKYRFQNNENMEKIKAQTYFIHGTLDGLIPVDNSERLFELSKAFKKEFYTIEGGDHNNLSSFEAEYFGALDEIFRDP